MHLAFYDAHHLSDSRPNYRTVSDCDFARDWNWAVIVAKDSAEVSVAANDR
jgi:hypothetical protein